MDKFSYVYMMSSSSRRALYTGVCASLEKRALEHKNGLGGDFTRKYKCYRLVYFERFSNIETAILREKEIKGWRRSKKNAIVESMNPEWKDLAADWYVKELLLDGKPVKIARHKVPRAARELIKSLASLNALRDDVTAIVWTGLLPPTPRRSSSDSR